MNSLFRRKIITPQAPENQLARTLSWPHLVALGVGAIVGTGILTLIGVGADRAGPGVILSFVIAGAICSFAALCYAEMATMIPASGSAYTYSYVVLGEIIAWVIGWSLMLEYSLVVSTVAVGWSGYAAPLLEGLGFPHSLTQGPPLGGIINAPAIFIIGVVAALLSLGTKESATLNTVLVVVKMLALALFVAVALPHFDAANLHPFMPYGFAKSAEVGPDGVVAARGVMAAAAIIFFAFYGFDAISTAAEETKNPGRDLAIGIVGSMVACVVIYILIGVTAVGALHYTEFANSPDPLAVILRKVNQPVVATILAVSAVVALPTVLLAFLFGQSRIFFTMARDGLLPVGLTKVSKRGSPVRITLLTAVLVAAIAGFAPIDAIAALANAGTLAAFTAVCVCVLVMRRRAPDALRTFRTPFASVVAPLGIAGCAYLFFSLPTRTELYFLGWNAFGLLIYFLYARPRMTGAEA